MMDFLQILVLLILMAVFFLIVSSLLVLTYDDLEATYRKLFRILLAQEALIGSLIIIVGLISHTLSSPTFLILTTIFAAVATGATLYMNALIKKLIQGQ